MMMMMMMIVIHEMNRVVFSFVCLESKTTQPSTQLKDTKSHFVACKNKKNKYKYKDQCTISIRIFILLVSL